MTWPLVNMSGACYGTQIEGFASNGQRAILVGGLPDETTAGHIFATSMIIGTP